MRKEFTIEPVKVFVVGTGGVAGAGTYAMRNAAVTYYIESNDMEKVKIQSAKEMKEKKAKD